MKVFSLIALGLVFAGCGSQNSCDASASAAEFSEYSTPIPIHVEGCYSDYSTNGNPSGEADNFYQN